MIRILIRGRAERGYYQTLIVDTDDPAVAEEAARSYVTRQGHEFGGVEPGSTKPVEPSDPILRGLPRAPGRVVGGAGRAWFEGEAD